jgi:endonuclease-8
VTFQGEADPATAVARAVADDAPRLDQPRPRRGATRTPADRDRRAGTWVYDRTGLPCRVCATPILARGQGDDNRTTYWCPSCQA